MLGREVVLPGQVGRILGHAIPQPGRARIADWEAENDASKRTIVTFRQTFWKCFSLSIIPTTPTGRQTMRMRAEKTIVPPAQFALAGTT